MYYLKEDRSYFEIFKNYLLELNSQNKDISLLRKIPENLKN